MIVAGIGCRKNIAARDVEAAIEAALNAHGLIRAQLDLLATALSKQDEPAVAAAAREFGVPLTLIAEEDLKAASARGLTRSAASLAAVGVASVSEAAALAAAGGKSRLIGPRVTAGNVTCALAIAESGQ